MLKFIQQKLYEFGRLELIQRPLFRQLSVRDRESILHLKAKPVAILEISPEQLVCENRPPFDMVTFLEQINGERGLSLRHLHLYPILKDYHDYGLEHVRIRFESYGFHEFQKFRAEIYGLESNEDYFWSRFLRAKTTFDSIRDQGYLSGPFRGHYILVHELGSTYEILSGHHRATALLVLGVRTFPVMRVVL